jgi:hypothetical protein
MLGILFLVLIWPYLIWLRPDRYQEQKFTIQIGSAGIVAGVALGFFLDTLLGTWWVSSFLPWVIAPLFVSGMGGGGVPS